MFPAASWHIITWLVSDMALSWIPSRINKTAQYKFELNYFVSNTQNVYENKKNKIFLRVILHELTYNKANNS